MDWTEKIEYKKKIRAMAYRMLWADVKDVICGWKGILVILIYLYFFVLPYSAGVVELNNAALFYLVTMVLIALGALYEKIFNYLPLSDKDILYYLTCRTNHLTAWMVMISVLTAIFMEAVGVEVFWERGLMALIIFLVTIEWMFFITLYGYSKPAGVSLFDADIPRLRKVRIVVYNIYSVVVLFAGMLQSMFMEYDENRKNSAIILLGLYLVMYIFRADAASWVRFNEYSKAGKRTMYATEEKQKR